MIKTPAEWNRKSIDEASTVIVSPVDKKSYDHEIPVELCNYMDVYYNRLINSKIEFMKATATQNEIDKFSLLPGDVIITKDSETPDDIGVSAYIEEIKPNLLCGYHLSILRPNKNLCGKYLLYSLRHPKIKYDFYRYANGVTRFGLAKESYSKITIPFPPLPEQRAIADILSTWDKAIEKMEKLIEAKEKKFKGLLKEIIENPINKEINTMLGKICIVKKGQQLNKAHMEDGGKYYALNGGIEPSGRTSDWNTEANTITISEGGNSCGFISLNRERFWSGGHCYSLESLNDNINVDYLYYYLKYFEPQIMRLRVGSGLPNIQKKDIDKFQLNIPKLEEQIIDALKLKFANNEIEVLKEVLKKYKEQKRGLMQKLLTGEWRVKV